MNTNDCFPHRLMPLALSVLLCGVTALNAATATLERTVLPAGGGAAASAKYTLTDTAGQPCVGVASSATYAVADGFWPDYGDPPAAAPRTLGVQAGETGVLPLVKLLLRSSDPNGETLRVAAASAISAHGGTVVLGAEDIQYTPAIGFSGGDTFSYVIADTGGDTAVGLITVTVAGGGQGFNLVSFTQIGGGQVRLTYMGMPGYRYALDRTDNLTYPIQWIPQTTNLADGVGQLIFTNQSDTATNNFWRTRYLP